MENSSPSKTVNSELLTWYYNTFGTPTTCYLFDAGCRKRLQKSQHTYRITAFPHTALPHFRIPHTAFPHTAYRIPHFRIPHTAFPHTALPHFRIPHTAFPHTVFPHTAYRISAYRISAYRISASPHLYRPHFRIPHLRWVDTSVTLTRTSSPIRRHVTCTFRHYPPLSATTLTLIY